MGDHRTQPDNTEHQRQRRARRAAEQDAGVAPPKGQEDWRLPLLDLPDLIAAGTPYRHVASVIGTIQNYKLLRGATASFSVACSTEYTRELTTANEPSAMTVLALDLYFISPPLFEGDPEPADGVVRVAYLDASAKPAHARSSTTTAPTYLYPQRSAMDLLTTPPEDPPPTLTRIGCVLAGAEELKTVRSSSTHLSLMTSAGYKHVLGDAAAISHTGDRVVVEMYAVERNALFTDPID